MNLSYTPNTHNENDINSIKNYKLTLQEYLPASNRTRRAIGKAMSISTTPELTKTIMKSVQEIVSTSFDIDHIQEIDDYLIVNVHWNDDANKTDADLYGNELYFKKSSN